MKTKYFIVAGAGFIILALVVLALVNAGMPSGKAILSGSKVVTTNNLGNAANNFAYQQVTLSMKDWKYVLEPATLKKGVPVRMTVDLKTVVGCASDVVIKDFGVRKAVRSGDNVIEFTPTKTGTIAIACSMNMFHGTFQVIDEANPNAPAEITAQLVASKPSGGCGMATGGGCGCGK